MLATNTYRMNEEVKINGHKINLAKKMKANFSQNQKKNCTVVLKREK